MGSNVNETPKGTSLRESASFEPSSVKIRRCDCRVARCDFVAQTNKASAPLFPLHDPPSQTQLQNDEIVPYLIFSEVID